MKKPSELKEGETIILHAAHGTNIRTMFVKEYDQLRAYFYHIKESHEGISIDTSPGILDIICDEMRANGAKDEVN